MGLPTNTAAVPGTNLSLWARAQPTSWSLHRGSDHEGRAKASPQQALISTSTLSPLAVSRRRGPGTVNTASLRRHGCLLTLTKGLVNRRHFCFQATRTFSGHLFSGKVREGIA